MGFPCNQSLALDLLRRNYKSKLGAVGKVDKGEEARKLDRADKGEEAGKTFGEDMLGNPLGVDTQDTRGIPKKGMAQALGMVLVGDMVRALDMAPLVDTEEALDRGR